MINIQNIIKKGVFLDNKKQIIFIKQLNKNKKNLQLFTGININKLISEIKNNNKYIKLDFSFISQKQKLKSFKTKKINIQENIRQPIFAYGGGNFSIGKKCGVCYLLLFIFLALSSFFVIYALEDYKNCEYKIQDKNNIRKLDDQLNRKYRKEMDNILKEPLKLLPQYEIKRIAPSVDDVVDVIADSLWNFKTKFFGSAEEKLQLSENKEQDAQRIKRRKQLNKELKNQVRKVLGPPPTESRTQSNSQGLVPMDSDGSLILPDISEVLTEINRKVLDKEGMELLQQNVIDNEYLEPEGKRMVIQTMAQEYNTFQDKTMELKNKIPRIPRTCNLVVENWKEALEENFSDGYWNLIVKHGLSELQFGFIMTVKIIEDTMAQNTFSNQTIITFFALGLMFVNLFLGIGQGMLSFSIPNVLDLFLRTVTFGMIRYKRGREDTRDREEDDLNHRFNNLRLGGKSKKSKKIRKHSGINQSTGRLKKGYKYSGKKLKSGLPQIIKNQK